MIKLPTSLNHIFPTDYIKPKIFGSNYEFEWDEASKGIPMEDEHFLIELIEEASKILPDSLDAIEKLKQKSMKITNMTKHESSDLYEPMIQLIHNGKYSRFSVNMTWDAQIFIDAEQKIGSIDIKWQLGQIFLYDPRFSR